VVELVLAGLFVKYFGEDRVLTIDLLAAIVVVALLFVALRFNAWLSKATTRRPSRSRLQKVVWLCWLGTAASGIGIDRYVVSGLRTKEPRLEEPTFEEAVTEADFSLGGMNFQYALAALEGPPRAPIVLGHDVPFLVYVKNRRLYVDTTVVGLDGHPVVEIRGNRFAVGMTEWDHNSSKQALEVVDADQNPVFQMIYRSPTHIKIDGIFPTSAGILWATPFGTQLNPKPPLRPLKRIFKYPAWRYPGVLTDQ